MLSWVARLSYAVNLKVFESYAFSEGSMKRIIILIDGTWNEEGKGNDTNIAKLDPCLLYTSDAADE